MWLIISFLYGLSLTRAVALECGTSSVLININPEVDTPQRCFEACASNIKCIQYSFTTICTNQILTNEPVDTVNEPTVNTVRSYVRSSCTQNCKAFPSTTYYRLYNATTNPVCFQACCSNPLCYTYSYWGTECYHLVSKGAEVDTTAAINDAYIYCNCPTSVADTTQNPTTTTAAATTTEAAIVLDCPASSGLKNTYPAANSEQECFGMCASNPKCTAYQYSGGCTNKVSNESPHGSTTLGAWAYVHCRCTKQCKALKTWSTVRVNATTTLGCFQACFANPRCFLVGFDGEEGTCDNMVASGEVVNSTINSSAYVYCESCDDPTTTTALSSATSVADTTQNPTTTTSAAATTTEAAIVLDCPASSGLKNTYPAANSEQECFEMCASNPKCHAYQYSGGCTNKVSNESPHGSTTLGAWAYVHCRCTKQCKALKTWKTVKVNETTTLGCFQACFANPRCFLVSFDGEEGTCNNMEASGEVVNSTINSSAYVYCESCDTPLADTTQNPTTTTSAATTTEAAIGTTTLFELDCPASNGLQNTYPGAKSEQECFEMCASNPKCHTYQYSGGCTNQVSDERPHGSTTMGAWAYVHCRCTKQCKALKTWKTVKVNETTTLGCFQACFANPRCFLVSFDGEDGTCNNMEASGEVVNNTVNSQAYVYCESCDDPTTTTSLNSDTSVADTTENPASIRYCYKCKSGYGIAKCHACPADGDTAGWTKTKVVSCSGPCVKTTSQTVQGTHIDRGCSDGNFPQSVIQANGCVTYLRKNTCFCSGDRCN